MVYDHLVEAHSVLTRRCGETIHSPTIDSTIHRAIATMSVMARLYRARYYTVLNAPSAGMNHHDAKDRIPIRFCRIFAKNELTQFLFMRPKRDFHECRLLRHTRPEQHTQVKELERTVVHRDPVNMVTGRPRIWQVCCGYPLLIKWPLAVRVEVLFALLAEQRVS